MAGMGLRFEDKLDGASNFLSWKERVTLLLKEHEIWNIVEKVVPISTYVALLAIHEKEDMGDPGHGERSFDSACSRKEVNP